jgi:hypothetical protein
MFGPEENGPSTAFPRTYRPYSGWAMFSIFCGTVLMVGGLVSVWLAASGVGAAVSAVGAYLVLSMATSKIVLRADAIEIYQLARARTLRRDQIRGWRMVPQPRRRGSPNLVFELRGGGRTAVPWVYQRDAAVAKWLNGLPDLDAEDRQESLREIAANAEIGATPEDRMQALRRAKALAVLVNGAAVAATLWSIVYPQPHALVVAVLAGLPLAAAFLAVLSPGLFRLYVRRNDAHPNLAVAFLLPGFALLMRAGMDCQVLEWSQAWWPLAVIGLGIFVVALVADGSWRARPAAAAILLFAAIYGMGAGLELNALADRSHTDVFATHVVAKRVGVGRSRTYHLTLGPWGPRETEDSVSVMRPLYDKFQAGDTICVGLRQGGLGIQWYTVRGCGDF